MLERPVSTKVSERGEGGSLRLNWASSCMQGWRVGMEDAHITLPEVSERAWRGAAVPDKAWRGIGLFGVFDGHGGEQVAKFCEHHLPEELCQMKLPAAAHDDAGGIGDALTTVFHRMDELLNDRRTSGPELAKLTNPPRAGPNGSLGPASTRPVDPDGVGCTACMCAVTARHLVVANSGDSRAVLCRGGRAVALSEDHKPNDPGELARIEAAGGYVRDGRVNGNLNLSRALGDLEYKKDRTLGPEKQIISATPDVRVEPRSDEDEFVLVCCDGVWDVKTNQEAVDFVRARISRDPFANPGDIEAALEALLDDCLSPDLRLTKGLGGDNMTAVCCRLPSAKALASAPKAPSNGGARGPDKESTRGNALSLVSARADLAMTALIVRLSLPEACGLQDISLRVSGPTVKLEVGAGEGVAEVFCLRQHLPPGAALDIPDGDQEVSAAKFFARSRTLRLSLPIRPAA